MRIKIDLDISSEELDTVLSKLFDSDEAETEGPSGSFSQAEIAFSQPGPDLPKPIGFNLPNEDEE